MPRHNGTPSVRIKRIYDDPAPDDGRRVLIDRLWPRGVKKDSAAFDEWLPELAPSTELRRWYGHDPAKFAEFARRYRAELAEHAGDLEALRSLRDSLTLLTAVKEVEISHAAVLAGELGKP